MKFVTITWKAFGSPTSVSFTTDMEGGALDVCNRAFRETNKYEGAMWNIIEPLLDDNRTHTALSVGDWVEVNGEVFECAPVGWNAMNTVIPA